MLDVMIIISNIQLNFKSAHNLEKKLQGQKYGFKSNRGSVSAYNQHPSPYFRSSEQVQLWEKQWWLMCYTSDLGDSKGV